MLPDEQVLLAGKPSTESGAPLLPDVVGRPFDALYVKYKPILRKHAIKHFHIPAADVDDLVQGVFTTYLERSEIVENPAGYLVGGICNAARQYWRQSDRRKDLFSDAPIREELCMIESAAELRLRVARALLALDVRCRDALVQYYLYGVTTPDLAAMRGITVKYVGRLLYLCRKAFRERFDAIRTTA